ncbi:hypothetical protein SLS62_006389 [Diatrype stigma]|uniref:Cytochrome P450 monooxygenase n=1 Tax=Diatrype stigma TaxID=117547 RepID=A0AAN9YMV5_9PEZI
MPVARAATIPNDGVIRYLGAFNQERLLLTGSKALADVLVTRSYEYAKPPEVQLALSRILGVGVLVAEGDEHKFQRKKLMPAFAFRHIKDLYPIFWEKSREAVQAMTNEIVGNASKQAPSSPDPEKSSKTQVIEVGEWASRATLDIIGVAGLGKDFGAIQNPDTELSQTYKNVFTPNKQAQKLALLTFFLPSWVVARLPVKRNNDILAASRTIRSVCGDLIREKREQLARREKDGGGAAPTGFDILSVALESGAFTDENLIDQLMTFLAAGHETTATAMTWAIYMLAKNPAVQARLRREVRAHLPSVDVNDDGARAISSADIDSLPYLNAVCSEVLRYYAPVPLTLRQAGPGAMLLGRPVPEGTRIILSPWATNFDPKLWGADAAEFRPERWLSPGGADDKQDHFLASGGAASNFAYLTFLHGPRSCIGQSFAKAEFACLLACWVGRFEFALRDEADSDERNVSVKGSGATAKPEHGMYVHATVVDGW